MLASADMSLVKSPLSKAFACMQEAPFEQANDDPTAALLRGAECNVCMNRPVQVLAFFLFCIGWWLLSPTH